MLHNTYMEETSVTADVDGDTLDTKSYRNFSLHIVTTGTLAGTFALEEANDKLSSDVVGSAGLTAVTSGFNWSTNGNVVFTNPSGSATNQVVHVNSFEARYMRLAFTFSSGTGNITVYMMAKSEARN